MGLQLNFSNNSLRSLCPHRYILWEICFVWTTFPPPWLSVHNTYNINFSSSVFWVSSEWTCLNVAVWNGGHGIKFLQQHVFTVNWKMQIVSLLNFLEFFSFWVGSRLKIKTIQLYKKYRKYEVHTRHIICIILESIWPLLVFSVERLTAKGKKYARL